LRPAGTVPLARPMCRLQQELLAAYRLSVPVSELLLLALSLETERKFGKLAQEALLACVKAAAKYPPARQYTQKVIREAVRAAERDGCEVQEQLLALTCAQYAQHSTVSAEEEWFYRTYSLFLCPGHGLLTNRAVAPAHGRRTPSAQSEPDRGAAWDGECAEPDLLLRLRVRGNVLYGGTGCAVWDAGAHLSHVVLSNPDLVADRCCLELGAGTGLLGLCLALAGSQRVVLTDGDRTCLENLQLNLETNGYRPVALEDVDTSTQRLDVGVSYLHWDEAVATGDSARTPLDTFLAVLKRPVDVVLAADVLYDPEVIPSIIQILGTVLAETPGVHRSQPFALFANAVRNSDTHARFEKELGAAGLTFEDVSALYDAPSVKFSQLKRQEQYAPIRMHRICKAAPEERSSSPRHALAGSRRVQ